MNISNYVSIPLVLFLAGCSSSAPDCGSSDTIDLITQIAASNVPNKLTAYIVEHNDLQGQLKQELQPFLSRNMGALTTPDEWPPEARALAQKIVDIAATSTYSLSEIVTNSVDPQTKNVSCGAKLTASSSIGNSELAITFTVQATSDGPSKVTVYGLR